jgi:hypothetical protein
MKLSFGDMKVTVLAELRNQTSRIRNEPTSLESEAAILEGSLAEWRLLTTGDRALTTDDKRLVAYPGTEVLHSPEDATRVARSIAHFVDSLVGVEHAA